MVTGGEHLEGEVAGLVRVDITRHKAAGFNGEYVEMSQCLFVAVGRWHKLVSNAPAKRVTDSRRGGCGQYLHVVAIVDGCDGEVRVERADEGADGFVRRGQGVAAGAEEEETDRHVRSHMVAVGNLAGRARWCECVLFKRHHYVHFEVTRRVSRAYLGRNSPVQTPEYPQGVQVSSARHHNGQRQRGHVDAHTDNLAILLLLR